MKKIILTSLGLAGAQFASVHAMNLVANSTSLSRLREVKAAVVQLDREVALITNVEEVFNQLAAHEVNLGNIRHDFSLHRPPDVHLEREAANIQRLLLAVQEKGIKLLNQEVLALALIHPAYTQMTPALKHSFEERLAFLTDTFNALTNTQRTLTPAEIVTVHLMQGILTFVTIALGAQQQ